MSHHCIQMMTAHHCQRARTHTRTHKHPMVPSNFTHLLRVDGKPPGAGRAPVEPPSPPPCAAKLNPAFFLAALHAPSNPRSLEPRTRTKATNQKRAQLFRQQMHQQLQLSGSRAPSPPGARARAQTRAVPQQHPSSCW